MKASLIAAGLIIPLGICLAQKPDESRKGATAQPDNQSATQAQSKTSTSSKSDDKTQNSAELKTQTYKGTLVDESCAAGRSSSSSATTPQSQSTADRSSSAKSKTESSSANKTGDANRAGDAGQSCTASANTTDFGLRMKDGHVMKFDSVGNERAKEAFTAKKKWSDASAAGKNIQVTVSGTESGDKLTVVSIH